MESKEIIANIDSIYERFNIPPNLIAHMKRVASVGALICDNLNVSLSELNKRDGLDIDFKRDDIVGFLLIHDLGNLIKFRFDSDYVRSMLGTHDEKIIDHWRKIREDVINKYGKSVSKATVMMASEIGVSNAISHLLDNLDFGKTDSIADGNDWVLKLCAYSDFRVGPFGVVSLRERIDDLRRRYQGQSFVGKEIDV